MTFKGIYDVSLGQVRFARLGLEIEQDAKGYSIACDAAVTGLVKLFARHESHTVAEGSGGKRSYESNYRSNKKPKAIKMEYKNGRFTEVALTPPEVPGKRPEVPADLKKKAYDPLLFILKMREQMAAKKERFSLDIFDGRRLTRAHFTALGNGVIRYKDKETPVIAASLSRELVAGFTAKELKKEKGSDAPVTIYFSDDARTMPLRLEMPFWLGTLSATLVKECRTGESCLLGIK